VGGSSGSMGMLCKVVEFSGSIMRALGHRLLLACSMQTNRPGSPKKSLDA
jgi:hypothetical protein